ncbi:MAG: hypothetical protein QME52_07940 [Bacteroidota bacterium]|nr:hypothetical protein [Bacteroidota bacterium]
MNCKEILELITTEIDGELEENAKPVLRHHIVICPICCLCFELERATKSIVQRRVNRISPPTFLKDRILQQIALSTDNS